MNAGLAAVADHEIPPRARSRIQRHRWFFAGMAATITLTVFVGFAPTYYLKEFFGTRPLPLRVHVHGALFTAWVLLLAVQIVLVATGRTALHRRLGVAGGLLVIPMVVSGFWVAVAVARSAPRVNLDSSAFAGLSPSVALVIPLTSAVLFPLFVGLGFFYRRRSDVHKRLMLLGTIVLLPPALGRIPLLAARGPAAFFSVTILFIIALAIYDYWSRGRVHMVTLWGGLFLAASFPGRLVLGNTATWQTFARWLMDG
jgi:hypothetical protein